MYARDSRLSRRRNGERERGGKQKSPQAVVSGPANMQGAIDDDTETLVGAHRRFEDADAARSRASHRWLGPMNRIRWARRSVGGRRFCDGLHCRGEGCAIRFQLLTRRARPSRNAANSICRMDESLAARMSETEVAGNKKKTEAAEGSALADFRSMEEELTAIGMESQEQEMLRRMKSLITAVEYHQASSMMEEFSLFPPPA